MQDDNVKGKVKEFFEQVDDTVLLNQLSYTPRAPFYMEVQYRYLALALRSAARRWLMSGSAVLDVGCGHGNLLRPLTNRYQIFGVDLSIGLLRAAKAKGIRVCQCDAIALPFTEGQFDAVICTEVMQHFPDPHPLLLELARVCRPEGMLILSTLNKLSLVRHVFSLLSRRYELGSLEVPIIKRSARELSEAGSRCGWALQDACWMLSPTAFTVYGRPPVQVRERLATNNILLFTKAPRIS